LGPSNESGLIQDRIILSGEGVSRVTSQAGPTAGGGTFRAALPRGDHREFTGQAQIVEDEGLSIVSDIDDTIKITEVRDTELMLKNTFLLPYRPVDGMAELYAKWAREQKAAFHYLTESPLELHGPYIEFLA